MAVVAVGGKKWFDGGLKLLREFGPRRNGFSRWRDGGCTCDEVHDGYGQRCCECDQSPKAVCQHLVLFLSEVSVSGHRWMDRFRILARCLDRCLEMQLVRIAIEA